MDHIDELRQAEVANLGLTSYAEGCRSMAEQALRDSPSRVAFSRGIAAVRATIGRLMADRGRPRKYEVVTLALTTSLYNGLVGAWEMLLLGYPGPALAQYRTLNESILYLSAIYADPQLCDAWLDNKLDADIADRTLRRIRKQGGASRRELKEHQRFNDNRFVQALGHASSFLGMSSVTVNREQQKLTSHIGPFFEADRCSQVATMLAFVAYEGAITVSDCLHESLPDGDSWTLEVERYLEEVREPFLVHAAAQNQAMVGI